ncbi:hypothetical protein HG530_003372 [Fusarium avenaceum]|nr:hypothetical protein HG530_003372 [Fusarium avenaceum]
MLRTPFHLVEDTLGRLRSVSMNWGAVYYDESYLVKVLVFGNHIRGETPPILALDNKIQGSIELTIQPLNITLAISLSYTVRRGFNGDNVLRSDNLSIVTDTRLSILQQGLDNSLMVAQLVANLELIFPRLGALAVVHTQLLGYRALTALDLDVPV